MLLLYGPELLHAGIVMSKNGENFKHILKWNIWWSMYPGHMKCNIRGTPPTQNVLAQSGVVGCGEVYLYFF